MFRISLLAALAAPAAAEELTFTWDPVVDTALAVSGVGIYGLLYTHVEDTLPPGDPGGQPRGIDAWREPRYVSGWDAASDVVLYGSMAGALAGAAADGLQSAETWGPRAGILTQTLALDLLLTDTLKLAVSRPRPYTRMADPDEHTREELGRRDATLSFPSGHASATAAASFGWARMVHISGNVAPQVAYPVAGGLTLAAAGMRVAAGVHYPSDVLAGALLGLSVGVLVPSLHRADALEAAGGAGARVVSVGGRW